MTNNTTADTTASNEWRLVPVTATVEMLKAMSVACGIEPLPTLEEGGDYPITGSQSTIKRSWDAAITLAPVAPDALRAREQGYADQHRRDSQELRRLCAERDEIKAERDTLRAQLEAAEAEVARLVGCLTQANHNAEEFERKWYLTADRAEAAEADAARYRWLRDWSNYPDHGWWSNELSRTNAPKDFDAAIDAAKAATP